DRGAGERERGVRGEGDAEDPGRDRDERADDRRDAAEEDRPPFPALEPALGSLEAAGAEMEPAAVLLEQRPAAVAADPPAEHRTREVAERPGRGDDDVRREAAVDVRAEDRDRRAERARRERPADDHH